MTVERLEPHTGKQGSQADTNIPEMRTHRHPVGRFETFGIVGCGHLGQALVQAMLAGGIPKSRILVSHRGRPSTYTALNKAGLLECVSSNEVIFRKANLIFLVVRPQDVSELHAPEIKKGAVIASCIAGVSLDAQKRLFRNAQIIRLMPSSPYSIRAEHSICAIHPYVSQVEHLLKQMAFTVFPMGHEEELSVFTAAVCLPTVLLARAVTDDERIDLIKELSVHCSQFPAIYAWAERSIPTFGTVEEQYEYLQTASTKGGITEAILKSLESGAPLVAAMQNGVARSQKISREMSQTL